MSTPPPTFLILLVYFALLCAVPDIDDVQPTEHARCSAGSTPGCATSSNQAPWNLDPNVTLLSADPVVVQIDDFLSDGEIRHIRKLAETLLQRSTIGMGYGFDDIRTSSSAWLNDWSHLKDPILADISFRMANLSGLPRGNMEPFQVLRYLKGESYDVHHDWLEEQVHQTCGPRIATFFMYLTDVEAGGNTHFPKLGLDVSPRRGRALLWWNVNYSRFARGESAANISFEPLVEHEAKPVIKGQKWSVNRWIHEDEYVKPYMNGEFNS